MENSIVDSQKWENVVSNLISGEYAGSPASVSRIHQEDMNFLVSSIKEEVRKTFRDEIKSLNFNDVYKPKSHKIKSMVSKIPQSVQHVTSIV